MTTCFKKLIFLGILVFFFAYLPKLAFASTLSLSPSSGSIPLGGNFTISVRLSTGSDTVNTVSAYISYPSDKLDVSYINTNSSAFAIQAEQSYGGGMIKIGRGNFTGLQGNFNVATITFKGKALGSASLSFVGGSHSYSAIDNHETLILGGGGNYTVIVAPTSTPADNSLPQITNIEVKDISTHSATIYWTTSKQSDSTVEYGIYQDNLFLHNSDPTLTTSHKITVDSPFLIPGLHFVYRLKSKDNAGNEGVSQFGELTLKGFTVKVTVVDVNGNPASEVEVDLYSYPLTGKTSASGEVVFNDVTPGTHLIRVKLPDNSEKTMQIEVKAQDAPQNYSVKLDSVYNPSVFSQFNILYAIGALGVLLFIVGVVLTLRSYRGKGKLDRLS